MAIQRNLENGQKVLINIQLQVYSCLPDGKKFLIAFQSAQGPVSGFIERFTKAQVSCTWDQLRKELAIRLSEVPDSRIALSLLKSVKQKLGENIQVYAERILSIAEEAFTGIASEDIERSLIDTFVDGLSSD